MKGKQKAVANLIKRKRFSQEQSEARLTESAAQLARANADHKFNQLLNAKRRLITRANDEIQIDNTILAYIPKQLEFQEYCKKVHGRLPPHEVYLVTNEKLYDFLTYVAFRPKREAGVKKKPANVAEQCSEFDYDEYKAVNKAVFEREPTKNADIFDTMAPENCIGFQTVNTYKCAIRRLWKEQAEAGSTRLLWQHVYQSNCETLMDHVRARKPVVAKRRHEEKMDTHFTMFKGLDLDIVVEEEFWEKSRKAGNLRSAFPHIT